MPGINTYDEHSIMMHFIGDVLEGDRSKLKGKKIAMLFHGSPYGREAIMFMDMMCKKMAVNILASKYHILVTSNNHNG